MTEPKPIADTAADTAPLPGSEEMDLRERMVIAEEQLGAHRAAILLLGIGVALLAVITLLRTRKASA